MTKTSLCPAVDDQGRKCRKLQPHFDYEHIFMDDPSKAGEKIPPALTPLQWHELMVTPDIWMGRPDDAEPGVLSAHGHYSEPLRHGIAALCLHGQPFGFTREMVEAVNALAGGHSPGPGWERLTGPDLLAQEVNLLRERRRLAKAAAERMLALLPPSDETPKP
jgi:hypothetical protein